MAETFKRQLYWLKRENMSRTEETSIDDTDVPHEFLCPITHEVMREPVKCSGILETISRVKKNRISSVIFITYFQTASTKSQAFSSVPLKYLSLKKRKT